MPRSLDRGRVIDNNPQIWGFSPRKLWVKTHRVYWGGSKPRDKSPRCFGTGVAIQFEVDLNYKISCELQRFTFTIFYEVNYNAVEL